eukprot:CAMPEP_0177469336 /NCGR_PEP_ID=MMETSP0369-20130122/19585_1 /TAXON_ID=447022 ORGANISM="Scrippsiella hangoei-like, Strain SHHI-4" /NCGR_SAMPLE_ID=MMETSP0369 /ASSEMBLY_ACC=CAM_ASM_000364 /LENGTH=87 /DNA_ID=CAMNT_0018943665 /DNA_START=293 /DNA_END=554 /DNA_ORIENTATION=+
MPDSPPPPPRGRSVRRETASTFAATGGVRGAALPALGVARELVIPATGALQSPGFMPDSPPPALPAHMPPPPQSPPPDHAAEPPPAD